MNDFSNAVSERLGFYVYILKDPETKQIFYVGKGRGRRIFDHVSMALENVISNDKYDLINKIINNGKMIEYYILRHNISEEVALEIESASIDLLGLSNLTNEVAGHNTWERGIKSIDEIIQFYDAKPVIIEEPAIIININKGFKRGMTDIELYNATRHWWKVGNVRNRAKYAIAAYTGLVREVYVIHSWNKRDDGRWEFDGEVASPEIRNKYINQSLESYVKKGSQNPIRYTFNFKHK